MARREGLACALVLLWLVHKPQVDWIYLELQGKLIHSAFKCVETGYCAGTAHGSGRADITPGNTCRGEYVSAGINESCGFSAALVIVVQHGRMVHIVLLDSCELAGL